MADNITVDNGALSDYTVKTSDSAGTHIQHMRPDLDAAYSLRIDEQETYTYIGHALPGSDVSEEAWRIKRLTNADGTILFASGGNFSRAWVDRESLTYA